jgi:hypothetical protein
VSGAAVCISGCSTIEANEDQVTIQYNSYYSGMAFSAAQRECGRFGRTAELVSTRPGSPSWQTAFTGTTISTFDCVAPPAQDQDTPS